MAKIKTVFYCQECGYESAKWLGKCPGCGNWNSFVEEVQQTGPGNTVLSESSSVPVGINDIVILKEERYRTGIGELDRVLGGGLVKGSLVLVGGDPGIGKSTLLLQLCENIVTESNVLYISGEESVNQIKIRADRLKIKNNKLMMLSETNYRAMENNILKLKPNLVIIDSIQTAFSDLLTSAPGSISQVREVTMSLMKLAKSNNITVIIVGHVTKEGSIAGPRVLEHMVDTVLYFEGERHLSYRILRAVKNRFGSTNEIGIFEMRDTGLEEVPNPSQIMLSGKPENVSGSVVTASVEGTRPMLIEIQSLVSPTTFGMPRRMATGFDYNRIVLLMAVLEKRVGMQMGSFDAYVNVVGGLKLDEPACDLAIIAALASSFRNTPIDDGTVVIGEVGLTGEVRSVGQMDKRIREAARIGYKRCVIPQASYSSVKQLKDLSGIMIKCVSNVQQALDVLL